MADYCGEYGRGTRSPFDERGQILGDFLEDFEMLESELGPFMVARLGICEGHGTGVQVTCDPEGRLWFKHVPLERRKRKGTPEPVEIPRSLPEDNVLPAKGELEALVLGFVEHAMEAIPDLPREDDFWRHHGSIEHSAFKLRRLLEKVEARAKSSGVPVLETPVVTAAPPKTTAEAAEELQRVEHVILRRFRTLDPPSLAALSLSLRFVVPWLEALKEAASKRARVLYAQDHRTSVAERQAENFPDEGDFVEHFHFGRCKVIKSAGDRVHLRLGNDGRIREIALEMLKVTRLDSPEGEPRIYRLDRRL